MAPTVYGNVLLGPTAEDIGDRSDTGTTAAGLAALLEAGHRMERSGSFAYGIRVRARPDGLHDLGLADLMIWA